MRRRRSLPAGERVADVARLPVKQRIEQGCGKMLGDARVGERMPGSALLRPMAVERAGGGQFFGEEPDQAQKILTGRRVEPQFRLEFQRLFERMAKMGGAMLLHPPAPQAHAS